MADGVDLSRFRFTLRGLSSAIRTLRALIWSLRALEADHHSRELSARLRNFERRSGGRIRGDADISCVAGPFFGDGLGVAHHRWGPGRWQVGRGARGVAMAGNMSRVARHGESRESRNMFRSFAV